jgi:hypothetical protein
VTVICFLCGETPWPNRRNPRCWSRITGYFGLIAVSIDYKGKQAVSWKLRCGAESQSTNLSHVLNSIRSKTLNALCPASTMRSPMAYCCKARHQMSLTAADSRRMFLNIDDMCCVFKKHTLNVPAFANALKQLSNSRQGRVFPPGKLLINHRPGRYTHVCLCAKAMHSNVSSVYLTRRS